MCARRRSNFLSLRRKKVTKERATLLSVTPALRSGATCDAHAGRGPRETRFAQTARGPFSARRCASRHGQKGTRGSDSPTGHRCARPRGAQALCAAQCPAERSDGPCRFPTPLLAAPAAGRLRGGMRVGARMLRCLARRGCSSSAPQAQSEFHGAPRKRPAAGLPRSAAQGSQTEGRLLFGDFLLATKRKLLRRRAHTPASALRTSPAATMKTIAAAAGPISA